MVLLINNNYCGLLLRLLMQMSTVIMSQRPNYHILCLTPQRQSLSLLTRVDIGTNASRMTQPDSA
jgi:hypothetical protein